MEKDKIISLTVAILVIFGVFSFAVLNKINSDKPQSSLAASSSPTPTPEQVIYSCEKGKNALELLKGKYATETKKDSIGELVTGINGVKPADKQFWAFLVDNKEATIGAQMYNCMGTEKIEWKLESF